MMVSSLPTYGHEAEWKFRHVLTGAQNATTYPATVCRLYLFICPDRVPRLL